ncbi:hypothetical protein AMTR_s00100p00143400 [Amborella trichopoda]|uniref:AP2/ERF domain-containing protein n=1 Tax=Amborella trichopoda TaxID=13333 RepID=W1NXT1_AMBTC|nr:hypothetical protein AMTR_s00100p00143400 [Amborella trichopoda]
MKTPSLTSLILSETYSGSSSSVVEPPADPSPQVSSSSKKRKYRGMKQRPWGNGQSSFETLTEP